MTPQEQQLIDGLIDRVGKTNLSEKDPDAEQRIQQALGRNPDALYILAQTVLIQQIALEGVQRQLADLRSQQQQQPKHATSFLGSIFGHNEPEQRPSPPPPPAYQPVPGYGPTGAAAAQYSQPAYSSPYSSGGQAQFPGTLAPQGGGFLRSALQTATGVAAGALAFQGIESLIHGFGSDSGSRGFGDLGGGNGRPEEIVNNYYNDGGSGGLGDTGLSPDIEDRRNDGGDALGTSDDSGFGTDDTASDDSTTDDMALDGSDGFDSSDSGDFGGGDDSSFS